VQADQRVVLCGAGRALLKVAADGFGLARAEGAEDVRGERLTGMRPDRGWLENAHLVTARTCRLAPIRVAP
jgi:hypothetical protein